MKKMITMNSMNPPAWPLILDGYMIMKKYNFESPSQVTSINIQKNNLFNVFEEDMVHFSNVGNINLIDNTVPLYKLRNFKSVVKINLSFNQMKELEVYPSQEMPIGFPVTQIGYFEHLYSLNLSFNMINPATLTQLLYLKNSLEILDL